MKSWEKNENRQTVSSNTECEDDGKIEHLECYSTYGVKEMSAIC